jgi:hypothetical protein
MASAGDELVDPATGERIVFCKTSAETAGGLLEMDAFWTRLGHRAPEHVHPEMQERWEVIAVPRVFASLAMSGPQDGVRSSSLLWACRTWRGIPPMCLRIFVSRCVLRFVGSGSSSGWSRSHATVTTASEGYQTRR